MIDARAAHDIDGTGDLAEFDIIIALDEGDLVGAFFEDIERRGPSAFQVLSS